MVLKRFFGFFLILFILSFSACSVKKTAKKPVIKSLVGKWKVIQIGKSLKNIGVAKPIFIQLYKDNHYESSYIFKGKQVISKGIYKITNPYNKIKKIHFLRQEIKIGTQLIKREDGLLGIYEWLSKDSFRYRGSVHAKVYPYDFDSLTLIYVRVK